MDLSSFGKGCLRLLFAATLIAPWLSPILRCTAADCAANDPSCHPEAFLAYRYPVARFAYVAGTSEIHVFRVNLADGALTQAAAALAVPSGPLAVAADPSGQMLYVLRNAANVIESYRIDGQTRALQPVNTLSALAGPIDLALHPGGRFLYAVSNQAGSIGVNTFAIDPLNAELRALNTFAAVGWSDPTRIAVSADGRFLNIGDDGASVIHSMHIDPVTGIPADNGTVVFSFDGELAHHPTLPVLYFSDTNQALAGTVDSTSGAVTQLGAALPAGVLTSGIAIDPRGRFAYFVPNTGASLFQYRIVAGGALSANSTATIAAAASRLAIDRNALFVLLTNSTTGTANNYRIDPASGQLQQGGQVSAGAGANSIAIAYF